MAPLIERVRPKHGFYFLGWVCVALGLLYFPVVNGGLEAAVESFIITGLAVIVLYTGYKLPDHPVSRAGQWRALLLGIGVMTSFTMLALAVWLTWSIDGSSEKLPFLLTFAAVLGAAVGTRGSLYAVESNERLARSRALSKLLRINQRVLRHNLRNELAIALGHLENVERAERVADVESDLAVVREHLEELVETTDRTRQIVSIWDTDTSVEFDLSELVTERVNAFREEHPNTDVTTTLPPSCRIVAHTALPRALDEALSNAVEHNEDVSVHVDVRERSNDAVVRISDTGSGIPKADLDAMELPEETPLFHTQGLGLWTIYWTVEMSEGTLAFEENDPQGTTVRMTLPLASRSFPTPFE